MLFFKFFMQFIIKSKSFIDEVSIKVSFYINKLIEKLSSNKDSITRNPTLIMLNASYEELSQRTSFISCSLRNLIDTDILKSLFQDC